MEHHLIYQGSISAGGVRNAEILLAAAMHAGAARCVLHICSEGGDVVSGMGLFNFIRALPVPVDTHAFGLCGSIAATVFLAGEKRSTGPASRFSVHAASNAGGLVQATTDLIAQPFRDLLGWDRATIDKYFSGLDDNYLTPSQAKELRIVQTIADLPLPADPSLLRVISLP